MTHKSAQVFVGQLDVFDPDNADVEGRDYAGELGLCAIQAPSLLEAVKIALRMIEEEGLVLKSIDSFCPIDEYEGNWNAFSADIEEFRSAAIDSGQMVFSDVIFYEGEK